MEIEQYFGILSLLVGLFLLYKFNPIGIDPFLREEAVRVLFKNAEADKEWNSQGRVYTTGVALIKMPNGRKKFIKTAKLADSGILHN